MALTHDDQDPEDENAELREDWARRVATGRPMVTYQFDRPLILKLNTAGQLDVDCPCLWVGDMDTAGVIRMRLSPSAIREVVTFLLSLTSRGDQEEPSVH